MAGSRIAGLARAAAAKIVDLARLAAIVMAALSGGRIDRTNGLLVGRGYSLAVLMTASTLPVVNILAVAMLLAVVAQVRPGPTASVAGPAALAATVLAVYRLVCDGSAAAWTFTNAWAASRGTGPVG